MRRRELRGGAGTLALGACTGLIPGTGEAPQTYVLTPKSAFRPDLPTVDWQLLVDVPVAPAEIDTTRIVLSRSPVTLDFFGNAVWPDRAPIMVQTLLVESFERTGRITAIGRETAGLRADYILKPELRKFMAVYYDTPTGAPTVVVTMTVRLVRMPDRTIIAQTSFDRREQAQQNAIENIVLAFDEALGGVLKRIIEWTLTTPSPRIVSR
jgi:cholesterol transport system auxiliary component